MPAQDSTKKRQSDATRGGAKFESHIKNFLNESSELKRHKIQIFDGKEIVKNPLLLDQLSIPLEDYQPKWRDFYLTAVNIETREPIALISCKLSLHGRIPETLFYSLIYKEINPSLKVVLVTPDKGKQKTPTKWKSEWGTNDEPTKSRAFARKYLTGVYVDNPYLRNILGFSESTKLGGNIKPFSQLVHDLINWK